MRIYKAILLVFLLISPARADYHYVSHEGANLWPYTSWETAALLIGDAIMAADPGDTVYIGAGDYRQQFVTPVADSNLAVIGAGMDSTYWWWDVQGQWTFWCGNNMLVKGIHFSHLYSGSLDSGDNNNIWVEDCLFTSIPSGRTNRAIRTIGPGRVFIENCIFDSVRTAAEIYGASRAEIRNCLSDWTFFGALSPVEADTAIIENNIFMDNGGAAVSIWSTEDSSIVRNNLMYNRLGLVSPCWHCPNVINNTFDNQPRDYPYAALYVFNPSADNFVNNSISRMATAIFVAYNDPGWTISASYFNVWDIDEFGMAHNYPVYWDTLAIQWAYPMYTGDWDYHLQAFSPLINAGDPGIYDVDGTRSDIGAYGGPQGTSYDYQDLPPIIPDSLSATVVSDSIIIVWRYNLEADFNRYQVHRETYSGFEPDMFNMIAEPDTSYYVDTDWTTEHNYYYRIAALDNQDNLSDYSEELAVITTGTEGGWGAEMPTITAIQSNYPNPFNSQTTIVYTVANLGPVPAQINIDIFDIVGRKVRTLVDERKEVGIHRITWDARNDEGSECPSGVYFARITQWNVDYMRRHQKLVLLK
jgi:hypothetical protein